MSINKDTIAMLDAITNPFGASETARFTDSYCGNSVCLTDWVDSQPDVGGDTAVDYQGFCIVGLEGYSNLKNTYCDLPNVRYQVATFPIIATTGLIGLTASSKITSYLPINYSTVLGSSTDADDDDCLVDQYRVLSFGIRAWPTVEVVTNSNNDHITRWYGGSISANSIYRSIVDGTNFINIMKQTDSVKMFAGYEGVSARFNPFQSSQLDLDSMRNIGTWNSSASNFSSVDVPIIMCLFNDVRNNADGALLYMNARFWLEGQLSLPTPIYSNSSPSDLNYPLIKAIMARPSDDFPLVTSGHTFPAFLSALGLFISALNKASSSATHVANVTGGIAKILQGRGNNKRRKKAKKRVTKQAVRNVYRPKQIIPGPRMVPVPKVPQNAKR